MKRLTLPILLLSVFLLSARTIPAQEILPVDQLKPGMVATAKTVFQGDQIEEFGVEIIDMLRNFYPKRDLDHRAAARRKGRIHRTGGRHER
ncbi:MAG: hypothetical protein Q9P14_04820 [candidate division KSB1 bacterium]|nr:hypothetical protein [candidate division KSB1 bacterium]